MTKKTFIIYCSIASIVCLYLMNNIVLFSFGAFIGYFPVHIVVLISDIMYIYGYKCYLNKHDLISGLQYEKYQIVNALFYGIQKYLIVIFVALILNILVVPFYYLIVLIVVIVTMFRWIRRI